MYHMQFQDLNRDAVSNPFSNTRHYKEQQTKTMTAQHKYLFYRLLALKSMNDDNYMTRNWALE